MIFLAKKWLSTRLDKCFWWWAELEILEITLQVCIGIRSKVCMTKISFDSYFCDLNDEVMEEHTWILNTWIYFLAKYLEKCFKEKYMVICLEQILLITWSIFGQCLANTWQMLGHACLYLAWGHILMILEWIYIHYCYFWKTHHTNKEEYVFDVFTLGK